MDYALIALLALSYAGFLWVIRDQANRARTQDERQAARIVELAHAHRKEIADIHLSHRHEIAALNQARMDETATLLQRIQAPDQAVATHAGDTADPDPPPVDLEDDQQMLEVYEERMRGVGVG